MDIFSFIKNVDKPNMSTLERAYAILWWAGREDNTIGMSTNEICKVIESAGHPKQNVSRINTQLLKDKLVCKVPGKEQWRLKVHPRIQLDEKYEQAISIPKKLKPTDSVLPRALFNNTRGYIEKVVFQINGSYDSGLFDCCAVMCRRLLETLIIEVYESVNRTGDIKNNDGHFFMFSDLLKVFEKDGNLNPSRNTKQALSDFKKLGDLSAHNRRFNARKEDIDRIRDGIRTASEELLHLSKII